MYKYKLNSFILEKKIANFIPIQFYVIMVLYSSSLLCFYSYFSSNVLSRYIDCITWKIGIAQPTQSNWIKPQRNKYNHVFLIHTII